MSIDEQGISLSNDLRLAIIEAVRLIRIRIRWRFGKDVEHLVKRIRFRHLAVGTTIDQYEAIIIAIVNDSQAKIYLFQYEDGLYPTFVSTVQDRIWLVMIGLDGTMVTAFPPSDPDEYFSDPAYRYVKILEELLR